MALLIWLNEIVLKSAISRHGKAQTSLALLIWLNEIVPIPTPMNQYEIMAPVGSREALAAALKAGADSIYFGIEALNMRAHSASRFPIDDLHDIVRQCSAQGET